MKKILATVFAVTFSAVSSFAFAEAIEISTGETIGPVGGGATEECVLLGEQVRVSLSSDVVAAFECEEVNNAIDIGTCHAAGQRATRTITCENFSGDPTDPVWNVSTCTTAGDDVTVDLSYTGYAASSTGGSVQQAPLEGNCNIGNLGAIEIFN